MIEWERDRETLHVRDVDNAAVAVRGEFAVVDDAVEMPRPIDESVVVTASELQFPHAVCYAFALGSDDRYELDPHGDPVALPPGEYVVDVDAEIKVYLQFTGRAIIEQTDDFESIVVSFPERTRVTLGFRSRNELPVGSMTVPDEPAAIAEAITHLGAAHRTDGPDRTYPTLRGHPPLLEPGDELEISDCLRADVPETGIELAVPPRYEPLYVTAPLAYYLQASVHVTDTLEGADCPDGARLRLPEQGVERHLPAMPALESDVERLLRKTFFLDCLVRNAGPYGTALGECSVLDALGLDSETLYEAPPDERLAAYLDVPFEAIEHRLPEWHLATYVCPSYDSLETLPFLLDRMSLIYRPRTTELEGKELVERSLEEFYRGRGGLEDGGGVAAGAPSGTAIDARTPTESGVELEADDRARASTGQVASVDIVKPELRHGRTHGWLAEGVPIDVFKSAPEAYRNRLDYLERAEEGESTSIRVVLNDPEMAGEHDDVAAIYRRRARERSMDVTVEESLETAELARLFESENDFVHYIGHCETCGLCCPDGSLSISSLDRCRTQTFFLNACGSFYEGKTLVEKGSVAGAVTFTKVLNDHAIKVGSAFATFLVYGFSIERAMRLARRRIMMGKDYAVVGDGTHSLAQGTNPFPTTITIEPLPDGQRARSRSRRTGSRTDSRSASTTRSRPRSSGDADTARYLVTFDCYSTRTTGSYYVPHAEATAATLCGNESNFVLSAPELAALLENTEAAVIYDGDVYWSRELCARFRG
ncbi:hypothetical protein [Halopiger xanaduensis]|uniref:CHAT domain-containing protein n=1 Tax=Halopiger xanaduensis (strain DSM 18323 / JCM 14033 / SH-6) TaxID=797210 RepID=F8D610_HALXS|nr:hypothetical protein [Halopiger xanaduensis]AEH37742.1 hypothetical protein Halxa_3128 [Halopiger xanaduensis SH-6]